MTVDLELLSQVRYRGQEITGARLRGLLALLAADVRAGCGTAVLVDALWPDALPAHPAKALQVLVSRARSRLGADVIASTPAGYRLALREEQVDASAVLLAAAAADRHARAGEHAAALGHAEAGLVLCDGAANWVTESDDPLSALRAARSVAYRSLVRARALALARLGRRGDAVGPLTELAARAARDEEVLAQLLRCEAATVGPAAALARYGAYRRVLRDELGADPGAELLAVHQELLRGTAPVVRHGVRHEPNPLLGRDADLIAVADLVHTSRVTSIVGPGGLGKTRLAHAVSRRAEQRTVRFVALAGVTDDGHVTGEVASVLGVGDAVGRHGEPVDVLAGIAGALGPGPALLVLDNCEHVVRGAADLVQALVALSRELRVLTTSRAPLGLSSESVYPLPELSLPTTIELFGQRALAARPGADLPAEAVRELCGRLEGLPLAVELAAARVRLLSVGEIARRLDDRFTLLRGTARDAPRRHRTLRDVIDWSWHLLEPGGQAAMRALSVFPDGFTADAARHVLGDDTVLEQLVDQSLLKVTDTGTGTRFRMLETVREFSAARRDTAGETESTVTHFLAWARDFGAEHDDVLFGEDIVAFARQARSEQDNLVQALRYALDRGDGTTVAITSAVLGAVWMIDSNFTRMRSLLGETAWVLSHHRPAPDGVEAVRTALVLAAVSGFLLRGPAPLRCLVALRRLPAAPPDTIVRALHVVLCAAEPVGLRDSDEPLVAGVAHGVLSFALESTTDPDGALVAAKGMLAAFQIGAPRWVTAVAHGRVGELYLQVEPSPDAIPHIMAALSTVEELSAWPSVVRARWAMALAQLRCGEFGEAEKWLARTVGEEDSVEAGGMAMFDVTVRAEILLARGDVDAGLGLWRAAADRLWDDENRPDQPEPTMWELEVLAVTVVAHARHGRLDLVTGLVDALPGLLSTVIADAAHRPSSYPTCGALLVALAAVAADRGAHAVAARATALAQRFRFAQNFQPTMAVATARQLAGRSDGPAYADAVSAYAGLDNAGLLAAALTVLRANDQLTASVPS